MERMLRLMKLMSSNVNYTVDELSRKLEMSLRTIYRYIDTFKEAGFSVTKLQPNVYKLDSMPENAPDLEKLIFFSEEEAYLVNSLIDRLDKGNTLKANLKQKLAAIYDSTTIADYVDRRSTATLVQVLGDAARDRRCALLHDYESGSSHTVKDRVIEPFGFTHDFADVWGYDLEDGRCKTFKIIRIGGEVEELDRPWEHEAEHEKTGIDIFRMSGRSSTRVRLQMSHLAKNLLVEEYPLSERDITRSDDGWLLDTQIFNFAGVGRFYLGLASEISIVDSPEFAAYIAERVSREFGALV